MPIPLLNTTIGSIRAAISAMALAAVVGAVAVSSLASAGPGQITRTELYKSDLAGSETTEVIVAKLELAPGAIVPRHSHNGTEHLVVLQGGTVAMPGGDDMEFAAGATMDFPRDAVHGGLTVTSEQPIVLLTVHMVDKGAPLNVPAS